jgi:hypothetical protein
VSDRAIDAVRDLLDRRVNLERVFQPSRECLREITRLSGGRLRDVLHLARLTCELSDPDPVTPPHVKTAARKLKGERLTLVTPDLWPRLAEIHRDKQVANTPADAQLLLHSLVLDYDGDPWWDVHPLVQLDRRFEDAWRSLSSIRTS